MHNKSIVRGEKLLFQTNYILRGVEHIFYLSILGHVFVFMCNNVLYLILRKNTVHNRVLKFINSIILRILPYRYFCGKLHLSKEIKGGKM